MKKAIKRSLSALLVLLVLVSVLSGPNVAAKTGTVVTNTGIRHQTATSLSAQAEAYYTGSNTYAQLSLLPGGNKSSLDTVDSELFRALSDLMSSTMTHSISYKSLTSYWPKTDANNGSSDAVLFYSDEISSSYNREHVWPKSRASFQESGGGADIHHLRPTNTNVNSTRGNYTMGNVRGVISGYRTYQYNGKDVLYYSSGNDLVEVNDNIKGDVARILLYVYCRWEEPNLFEDDPSPKVGTNDSGGNNGKKVIESLDTLLQWCEEDPVDTWEICRNDQGENLQGNRNVFIDYPEFAWLLFGREIPGDMPTPSGEAGNSTSAFTVEAVCNNNAWGTVSVSGTTITAEPAEGYYAGGSEVIRGTATVTQNGNIFRVTPTSDCTVRINFAAKTAVTVSFSGATAAPISGYAGEAITLPTPTGVPADYTFVGWTEAPLAEATTQKPNYYAAGSAYTPTGNVTLYALFSYTEGGGAGSGDVFTLVTGAPSEWSGEYVLTSTNAAKVLLADGTAPGTSAAAVDLSSAGMTLSGNTLSGVTDKYILVVEKVGSNYSFRLKGASGDQYLAQTGSGNGDFETATSNTQTTAQWGISLSNGEAVIKNASYTNRTIRYNSGSTMFRTYTSGQQAVYLYAGSNVTTYYTSDAGTAPTPPAPCEHENVIEVPQTPPTCTENGNKAYWRCLDCGKYFSDATLQTEIDPSGTVIPATGHKTEKTEAKEPTCTEPGNYEYWYCSQCGKYFKDREGNEAYIGTEYIREATGHKMQKTEAKEPTCTEPGNYEYWYCSQCGKYFKDQEGKEAYKDGEYDRAANGHTLIETPAKDPTEEEAGNIRYWYCSVCGKFFRDDAGQEEIEEQQTIIPPLTHQHVLTETQEKQPTCTEDGNIHYWYCALCQKYYRDADATDEVSSTGIITPATGHKTEKTEAKNPTCTEPGNYEYWYCPQCGKYFKDQEGNEAYTGTEYIREATGHKMEKTETKEPTCTEPGNYEYWYCSQCGKYFKDREGNEAYTGTEYIREATGHKTEKTEAKEPTCTEPGNYEYWYCSQCGKYFKDQEGKEAYKDGEYDRAANGHTLVETPAKDPTEEEAGNITYWYCSVCEKYFDDADATTELEWSQIVIPPLNHRHSLTPTEAKAPTCVEAGNIGYWYCEGCGKYFSDAEAKNEIPKSETILPSFDCPTEDYKDIPLTEWYHDHVDYVVKNGLMQGTDKNVFEPDTKLSRAMVATVLYRMAGSQPVAGKTNFTDVPNGEWYTDAVVWAESTGVVKGYGDGTFGPEDLITREQMMLMLARYAEIITKVDTTPTGDLKAYSDAGTVSDWAVAAVTWCVANEIVNGDGTGKLVPLNTASRAEFAKIIACFDARYNK